MTPPIVLQEGTWARCCGLAKHLEDKPGARSSINFSALFLRAQVLWRVCGQQSAWRAGQSDARSAPQETLGVQAEAARGPLDRHCLCESLLPSRSSQDGHERNQTCDSVRVCGVTRRGLAQRLRETRGNSNGKTPNLRRHDKMPVKHPPRRRDKSCVPVGVVGPRDYSPRPSRRTGVGRLDVVLVG